MTFILRLGTWFLCFFKFLMCCMVVYDLCSSIRYASLNDNLASISRWATENRLSLNPHKSLAILISISNVSLVLRRFVPKSMLRCIDCVCWSYWLKREWGWNFVKLYNHPYFFYCDFVFSRLSSVDIRRLQVARGMSLSPSSTHRDEVLGLPNFTFYDFLYYHFFKLILTRRPTYLFIDVRGARSVRTSNFIFQSVCPSASVPSTQITRSGSGQGTSQENIWNKTLLGIFPKLTPRKIRLQWNRISEELTWTNS
jgi:hypothetical protein